MAAGDEHPWPERLAPSWHSEGREPVAYIRVVPELVVVARVDAATVSGARYLRMCPDLSVDDVPHDLDLEC